ncbi:hypothetical protein [Patulibacter sp.]|uniref:hypothetical protein n=1 Tax=Patulibacter sp. TaxID=1912859 RepID=UPI0027229E48|nr:hypothetical protein [Patulibacter sp.]MDO9408549.1 hypothetical protein [Patulibacter sp.]
MDEDRYLTIYLQDHLTAATAGIGLTRRAKDAAAGRDEELHAFYAAFEDELLEERGRLLQLLRVLGAGPNTAKAVAATVGERLGRLKLNGHLVSRSPYSDLVELEGLSIAVQGKRLGWIALQERAHPEFDAADLERLVRQAEDQHERLEALRRPRAARVLAGLTPTPTS